LQTAAHPRLHFLQALALHAMQQQSAGSSSSTCSSMVDLPQANCSSSSTEAWESCEIKIRAVEVPGTRLGLQKATCPVGWALAGLQETAVQHLARVAGAAATHTSSSSSSSSTIEGLKGP
jgi:hypothetical protein